MRTNTELVVEIARSLYAKDRCIDQWRQYADNLNQQIVQLQQQLRETQSELNKLKQTDLPVPDDYILDDLMSN